MRGATTSTGCPASPVSTAGSACTAAHRPCRSCAGTTSAPVLRGDDECTADDGGGATGVRTTQGSAACHSGSVMGTARDLATCVVVKVLLPSNSLIGSLDGALCELPFLQHLDLSDNALTGSLPSAADCLPRLTYLDLAQTRSWDDEGRVAGPVPEWLLDRLDFMAPLQLANNALDDLTTADSAVAISRLWLRCPSARSSARESCRLAAAPSTTRARTTRWSSMASVACAAQRRSRSSALPAASRASCCSLCPSWPCIHASYAICRQHRLEAFLYAVDILSIIGACMYGTLTHDDAVQEGPMWLALELGLGALLGASVLVAALGVLVDIARES